MKRIKIGCWWFGHDIAIADHTWECQRCKQVIDYDEAVKDSARKKVADYIQSWKDWWKCSECGRRFGKHDDSPHIPF